MLLLSEKTCIRCTSITAMFVVMNKIGDHAAIRITDIPAVCVVVIQRSVK